MEQTIGTAVAVKQTDCKRRSSSKYLQIKNSTIDNYKQTLYIKSNNIKKTDMLSNPKIGTKVTLKTFHLSQMDNKKLSIFCRLGQMPYRSAHENSKT